MFYESDEQNKDLLLKNGFDGVASGGGE